METEEYVKNVTQKYFNGDETNLFQNELKKESDRGIVIISAAYLEHNLVGQIKAFLNLSEKQFNEIAKSATGPLSTFYARVFIADALGLNIDRPSYDMVRNIRNHFAHKIDA